MESNLTNIEKELLEKITDKSEFTDGAFNIRENGEGIARKTTERLKYTLPFRLPPKGIYR